jgi:PhnB protein
VTPYLCIAGAAEAIAYYQKVFGAVELMRLADPSGKIGHAEIKIGTANVMLADEFPDMGFVGPKTIGGSPVALMIYVADADAVVNRAVESGSKLLRPIEDHFYGDRSGKFEDPFGHIWNIATHFEDVSIAEMKERAAKLYGMA